MNKNTLNKIFILILAIILPSPLSLEAEELSATHSITQALDRIESERQGSVNPAIDLASSQDMSAMEARESKEPARGEISSEPTPLPDNSSESQEKLQALDLRGMEIQEALKLISEKTGLNIVVAEGVSGKVTIYLRNVEPRDALNTVVESKDLAYIEDEDSFYVMTQTEFETRYGYRFGEQLETKTIQLEHSTPANILPIISQTKSAHGEITADDQSKTITIKDFPSKIVFLETIVQGIDVPTVTETFDLHFSKLENTAERITPILTPNISRISFDDPAHQVIVTDTPAKIEEVRKLITEFDQKEAEVVIEAKIVQIILNEEHKLGVDWEAIVSDYHSLNFSGDLNAVTSSKENEQVGIGTIAIEDYSVLLQALNMVGKTNIFSNPNISAFNNQEARLVVGSLESNLTVTSVNSIENMNMFDVGVQLLITPSIHTDGYVTMRIKPEVSGRRALTDNIQSNAGVETSAADTTVMVKSETTIVIGGLIKEKKINTVKKAPLLSNIPIIGDLFKSKQPVNKKTELVIFLTPRIISQSIAQDAKLTKQSN